MRSVLLAIIPLVACAPVARLSGSAALSVQPSPPTFAGQYDFDLLERVRGKACIKQDPGSEARTTYWVGGLPFESGLPKHSPTVGAVAAASLDAIDRIIDADTILLTRVVTEAKANNEVCAYVYGRAVRLKKATASVDADASADADADADDAGAAAAEPDAAEPDDVDPAVEP